MLSWFSLCLLGSARALPFSTNISSALLHWSTPQAALEAMAGKGGQRTTDMEQEIAVATQTYEQQRSMTGAEVYAAQQRLWFETRHKRGPPSTAVSSLATPQAEDADMTAAEPATGTAANQPRLFQPITMTSEAAYQVTAGQRGVDINDRTQMEQYLSTPLTTRAQVLETIRDYHVSVIRPEMYNLVTQMESVLATLDDRLLRQQDSLQWLCSENRQQQKRECGLMVVTTGWPQDMSPTDRLEMINWMLGRVEEVRQFLMARQYNATDSCNLWYLSALQVDPSTPPAGEGKWSSATTLLFKAWDLRRAFMGVYSSGGTPVWREGAPVRGYHVKCAPSSPQFQRKLELPLRVILKLYSTYMELQGTTPGQLTILWRTLTMMAPSDTRAFNSQAIAWARLIYFEQDGQFKARLEVVKELMEMMRSTPPPSSTETSLWNHCWNSIVFGIQHELDVAEKQALATAQLEASGRTKGYRLGKGKQRWSSPFIYSSNTNPYPITLQVAEVTEIYYSWDEYCDKFGSAQDKCGDYSKATYCGAPAGAEASAAPSESL